MRKTILIIVSALLVIGLAGAQPGNMPDTPDNPPRMQSAGNGSGSGGSAQMGQAQGMNGSNGTMMNDSQRGKPAQAGPQMAERRGPPENVSQHLAQIQQRIQERTNKTVPGLTRAQEAVRQRQRGMSQAVHGLLEASNLTGGIGPQVREIAKDINGSMNETVEAETEIRNRGGVARFLFGGDHQAAQKLDQNARQNLERVQQLRNTLEDCENCSEEVESFMRERVQEIQRENERLQELAREEDRSNGIFGWLWN